MKCTLCRGSKITVNKGNMNITCERCNGTGRIEDKVTDKVVEPVKEVSGQSFEGLVEAATKVVKQRKAKSDDDR